MLRLTDVVKNLLIINVLMFLAGYVLNTDMLALRYPGSEEFQPFQLVTHFFMHGSFMHILFNMWALVLFGAVLETVWGAKKFLFYYLFCAFGAAILHMGVTYIELSPLESLFTSFMENPDYGAYSQFFEKVNLKGVNIEYRESVDQIGTMLKEGNLAVAESAGRAMEQYINFKKGIPVVGASGAIFGLLLAFGMLFPENELMLIFIPYPIKAKYFIPILIVIELFLGVQQFSWDNIAHFAHLGGALFGFLLIMYWRKTGEQLY